MTKGFSFSYPRWRLAGTLLALLLLLTGCASASLHPDTQARERDYLFRSKESKERYVRSYNAVLELFEQKPEELDVKTRFGTAHVLVLGTDDKPVLLLLHGMDASSTMWYPNMTAWSKTHRVIAVDYIMDAGKSVLRSGPLSKQEISLFYADIMDRMKIKKASVLGTSRGGWIAAWLGITMPERIEKLVLMSPAQVCGMVKPSIFPAVIFKLFPTRKNLKRTLEVFAEHPENVAQEYKDQFLFASQAGNSKSQFTHMLPFSKSSLGKIKAPVLYLYGERDVMNGKKAIKKAAECIPSVEMVEVKDAGHFMSTDQPEKVNQLVSDFLNR